MACFLGLFCVVVCQKAWVWVIYKEQEYTSYGSISSDGTGEEQEEEREGRETYTPMLTPSREAESEAHEFTSPANSLLQ